MPSPSDASHPEQVEVICVAGAIPFVAEGRIVRLVAGRYIVDLDREPTGVSRGTRVILNFPASDAPRIIASAIDLEGNRLTCEQQQLHERERRSFPRLVAGVPTRYRIVKGAETMREVDLWLKGSDEPLGRGRWYEPDELMNFSVTGLRFDTRGACEKDDLMLVEFGLAGREDRWRCTARVRRILPPGEEDDSLGTDLPAPAAGSRRVAISFEQIPPDAEAALTEMTLAIQDAML